MPPCQGRGPRLYRSARRVMPMGLMCLCAPQHTALQPRCGAACRMLARVGAVAPELRAHCPRLRRATTSPCPHRAAIPLAQACRAFALLTRDSRQKILSSLCLASSGIIPSTAAAAARISATRPRARSRPRPIWVLSRPELGVIWAQIRSRKPRPNREKLREAQRSSEKLREAQRRSRKPRPMREKPLRITFSAA